MAACIQAHGITGSVLLLLEENNKDNDSIDLLCTIQVYIGSVFSLAFFYTYRQLKSCSCIKMWQQVVPAVPLLRSTTVTSHHWLTQWDFCAGVFQTSAEYNWQCCAALTSVLTERSFVSWAATMFSGLWFMNVWPKKWKVSLWNCDAIVLLNYSYREWAQLALLSLLWHCMVSPSPSHLQVNVFKEVQRGAVSHSL